MHGAKNSRDLPRSVRVLVVMNSAFHVLAATVLATAIGCSAPAEPPASVPPTSPAAVAAPAPATAMAPAADPAPAAAPLTATAGSELGTRPEGIGLAPGAAAPDAEVHDLQGQAVQLSALFSRGPTLLVFYRGGWCPYCNTQVRQLTEAAEQFSAHGVALIMISVDRPEAAATTEAAYDIPFPVLSDSDLAAHRAYHVVEQVGPEDYERLTGYGIDLEAASGRDHHSIAIPSAFLIDDAGVIRWSHAARDYKTRPTVEQLLAAVANAPLR